MYTDDRRKEDDRGEDVSSKLSLKLKPLIPNLICWQVKVQCIYPQIYTQHVSHHLLPPSMMISRSMMTIYTYTCVA